MHTEINEIKKLSSEVIDQIAAGEVVERPANLIKELVENAVDAGATKIEVEVGEGGRHVIINDNGHGIPQDRISLALERHTTSKIRKASDLWQIHSFGFRGEALASIAAISELSIASRTNSADSAYRLLSEFGTQGEVEKVGGSVGTTIEIRRLFENTPARLKFLKSESGEVGQIKHILKAMGLVHWNISFRLKHRGKLVFFWPAVKSLLERAQQVLDKKKLYQVNGEYEGVHSEIIFSSPHETFGTSRNIWLFVQNRWVQDRSLQAAVLEGYRGLLMHGEYPFVVASLSCDPQVVDVNIHPTKSQVKFQNQQAAFRSLQRTLRGALESAPWVETVLRDSNSKLETTPFSREAVVKSTESYNLKFQEEGFQRAQYAKKQMTPVSEVATSKVNYEPMPISMEAPVALGSYEEKPSCQTGEPRWGDLQVLCQADNTYVVAQNAEKIIFIDQHAAHERIAYEKLMKLWNGGRSEVQQYLIPLTIDLPEHQAEAVMTCVEELSKLGLSLELGGPSSLLVRSAPVILKEVGIVRTIHRLAEEITQQGDSFAFEKSIAEVCATMACHSVIRAGQTLSLEEMQALLKGMDEFALSTFCPHGRPVFVEYPFSKLQRDFGRIL